MKPFTIRPNNQTEELLEEMIEHYGCSKVTAVDMLAEKYQTLKKENERLSEELDENKKIQKSILRKMEDRLDVLYELENTTQVWQQFQEFHPTDDEKSPILLAAEDYVDLKRKEAIFHQLEKRAQD